ncbi:MAG: putative sugar O-methyltransferase [Candidatus Methanoperedens sp.]
MKQKPTEIIVLSLKFCIDKVIGLLPVRFRLYTAIQLQHLANMVENVNAPSIQRAISASNSGDYGKAESYLLQASIQSPNDPQIAPHLGRVRFLQTRSADVKAKSQTQSMLATINSMNHEIESHTIYVPGEFWNTVGKFHVQILELYGIENFKRTVSHHYQNWFMCSQDDPQVRQLFKTWPMHFATEPWFNIIEIPDNIGLCADDDFKTASYPLADAKNREIYRVAVGLLWEFVKNTDSFNVLEKLTESEIGNPIRIWRKGHLISSDLAHSVRERNMLLEALSLSGNEGLIVGELGAGHGRLAEIFGRTTNFRHFIFDITPALFVSQWYIKALFPNEKIFEFRHFDDFAEICDELHECRFAFFTSNQIEKFPNDYFNIFINMNSLAEMKLDQIKNFLHHIDRMTSEAFLSRQQQHSVNPVERIPLSKADFSMPERWRVIVDKEDDIFPLFFNQIWKR